MRILTLKEIEDSCVYNIVYEYSKDFTYNDFWNEKCYYISMEDMLLIEPYIDKIFVNFNYYGPNKVEIADWNKVKELYLAENTDEDGFFEFVDKWLENRPVGNSYFWILGP